jgi:hypothetical protein
MTKKLNDCENAYEEITIILKPNETFEDPGKEFFMDGKMYDVKSISVDGNKVHLLVIHDTKEENVLSIIKTLINKTTSSKNPLSIQLNLLLSMVYLEDRTDFDFTPSANLLPAFQLYSEKLISAESEILSPPPRMV